MSKADKLFVSMCRDILDHGTTTEGEKVRPVWAVSYTHLDVYKRQLDERVELARRALDGMGGVDVMPFTGRLVDFAREVQADAVVKGLRAMTDFEYELQQADLNYCLLYTSRCV